MRDISTYPPIIVTAKTGFRLLGQRFEMTGTEHVPRTGGVLLAVNHIGYVDFVYGGLAANPSGRKVRFMAKRELFDHRLAGPLMRSLHHIEVDRGAGEASLRHGGGATCEAGEAVGIFPEATISRAMELKEFKTGAVRIAAEAGVPLVPVILWGTQRMMTKDHPRDFSRGKTIAIRVGEPLHPTGEDPVAETAELHARDGRPARRDHRRLPGRRAAARLLVAAGPARRLRAHARGGGARSTPRRSARAAPRGAAPIETTCDYRLGRLSRHDRLVDKAIELVRSAGRRGCAGPSRRRCAQVVQGRELDGDLALALAEVDLDPGLEPVGEPLGQVGPARARWACAATRCAPRGAVRHRPRRSPRGRAR